MASCSTTETVQLSFSSRCSKPQPENDVFLNFRGEDTRNNFTDHLDRALVGKRIKTFKDDTKLEPGNPISQKLLEAIEKSRIAVVILSENYASSTWCLNELVKIIECKERGLIVLPVFYHVEPKIVRHQKKTFAVAFAEHENRFQKEQVEIWRKALRDVAELSGKTLTNGPEGKFIQEIADWMFTILKDKRSIVYEDGFVGIDSRVEEMNLFLDMNSNDVRFIGICGKSGMGKTTLARFVFDKICNQFEACSFLENVKEVSKARGLETLQEQLLCDISKGALRVREVSRGIQVIRNILRDKKVLIVVDDASEKRHLEALVGKSWFGPRSRIIVTTENECLLKSYEIRTVYKADGLNNDEAQQIFSHKAHCEIDFLDLGNDFVTYAQGSPLVLKVLGSHLCKRTKEEWETAWNQLKEILNEDIPEKLRIAYNGLEELEKKLFLHIACFFKGEDQNRVAAILESVCYSDDNIRKLIDKSLITIVGGKLCMHHLIQQMGWKIVCGESPDLGKRSRLWDCTDVLYVLKNNIGTERIEGMVLNLLPNEEQEKLYAEPFSKMNKLKLLKICKLLLPCLGNLSNELLLLEWHEYPLKSLPKGFQPPELVELIMHHSGIRQLPSEFSNLHKLKLIDLRDSQNLCQTPNFNGLPNIERLIFQGCTGLHALHPSVGGLERLILLNLKDCTCLENLPHEINLNSLKILILSGCSKLKKFPKIGRNMTSMLELYLDRTAIEELPSSIRHLTSLTLLNLQDCENLSSFPSDICSLISLEILILSGCKGQPPKARHLSGLIPTLSSIGTTLTLPYAYLTDRQPEPEPISLVLPLSFSGLSPLVSLNLGGCNLLDGSLPDDLSYLSSLTSLNLRNNNFTCLPCSISQLLNLKLLFLDHCSKLQSLPYLPLSTQFVSAQGCTSLENYSNLVIVWTSGAARFTFINCHGLADDEEGKIADVPLLNVHFQSLWQRYMEDQILQIEGFCLVLPQIEIPEWFKNKECGPSVRIPLPPNLFNNRSWKGIILCVIFVVPPNLIDVSPGQDSKCFHEFVCHFDMDGSLLNCPLVLKVPKETFVGSFGLWLYISHARFTEHFDKGSCISSLIRPRRLDIQIKMCGARILYKQDMLEFVQNLRQENFRSCDDLSRGHEKFKEDRMSSSQGYDLKLKQKLNSLLSSLYQVDWAKNHLYDYIFHQIAHPPCWFACKHLGPSIEMQLPADVHYNSTWLGFTICALYRIMRAGFSYKLHSTIFLRHSSRSASDEVSFASYTTFPLSTDVFDESPQDSGRLVVFYIPRRGFQLKQCDHIGASFESSDPAVQFEMCGIRLVYEQNVPEFVQTLVECMLGSPDANHQSFSVRLSDQLGMMQYCNHEKENCCPFLPERRLDPDTMRMLLPNNEIIQEECTSRETFSNQVIAAGISKNSSRGSINLGIPFGNGQYGSKMSGHLECWFKPYLQNHNKRRSTFNRCSPQSEIPMWFTKKINGSSVRIPLHSNFYNNPDWIGFAISAVFSSHMNPTTTRSRFSHMAICHLKTNLGCMNPLLYCGIREEHVLTLLHQRIFLWESIISHLLLSPKFSECTWVEFSFVSDSPDMSARKCAVDLVYRDNLEDFTLTMAPCITSCDDRFTSNERLPFYHRDKFSGSDGLYEDQTNGTSGQYSYGGQHPRYQLFQTAALDFFPSTPYNCCFPPSKIRDWFSHQNHGCSATMDLPSNLYHNSNWMGLVLYASFSIQGDSNFILSNLNSGKSHSLYCQCQMSMANVDDLTIAFSTSKEEITWLLELGEFIWISYVPGEPFKNMLQHYSRIVASFVSDWPGVIVQNCALQLLYQHDQVQFEQELKHCNNLISVERELVRKDQEDQKKRNEQYHADEGLQRKIFSNIDFEFGLFPRLIDQWESDETETELGQSDLLENPDKVVKWRVASKEVTKISREHLEKCYCICKWILYQHSKHCKFGSNMSSASTSKNSPGGSTNFGIPSMNRQGGTGSKTSSTGTSKNSSRDRSINLGIPLFVGGQCGSNMSSSLESRFGPYMQDRYNHHSSFNHCFPQTEIPEWFCNQSTGFSVRILLPPYLYDDPDWMGFAFCAVFSFHKHPTLVRNHLDTGASHLICCQLKTNLGAMIPLLPYLMREDEVLISLCHRAFIWVSFIPRGILSAQWSRCTWVEFFFLSDSPDVSPLNCGVNLLYQHNLQAFTRTMVQCLTSYIDYLYAIHTSCLRQEIFIRLPYSQDKLSGSYGYEKVYEKRYSRGKEIGETSLYKTGPLDFHPCTLYNFVFPPSKIQEWFSHQSHGNSVTIDLPSNLYHDNDLMGLILYASFSFHGNPDIILNYLTSGISHFLYCQFQTITANVFDTIIACDAAVEAIMWLINLSEFIWISYIPGEPLKEMLQHSSDIKATFVSDWPDMMVQKCALHLLYQHDQVQFEQELRHCNDLILEQREIVRKHTEDYEKKRNEQCGVDEKKIFSTSDYEVQLIPRFIEQSKTNETKTKLGKSDLLDFDQCRVYNSCFPLCEILEWFSHQSDEPPVTIPLPPNVFNDNTWMGLVLCASIAVEANPTAILDIQNSETTYNLICHLETNIECVEPLHVHHITEEDLKLLQQGGFIWLSYIPRGSFQESLNQCSQIEASVQIDFPGLVQKSGFHLLYKHDVVEFKETIRQCMALFSNEHEVVPKVIDQSETNETKTQLGKSDLLDFDQCRVYKSCFPLREIPEWFSHQSNEAPVTIPLPPNVYNDSNWMGLALCAYVAIEANLDAFLDIQNSETSYNLICHLETSIECAEPLHVHHITKEDRKLLQQGGFIWLSYIPRGSFRDSLNQCSRIEASVVIDFPGLVQKCGFHLLYKHDEVEFKETIRQCVTFFSNEDEVSTKISSSSKEDSQSEPVEPANCKDKGKRVLEY